MMRPVLAVIAGFAAWSAAWNIAGATSFALVPGAYDEDRIMNSTAVLLVFLVLSFAFSVGSGFLTAIIARAHSMKPAWALGVLLLATGIFFQIQYWDLMPLWYHIPFLGLLVPGAVLGARLRLQRTESSQVERTPKES